MTQAVATALSILMEAPVVVAMGRRMTGPPPTSVLHLGLIAGAATLVTHPAAWWGILTLTPPLGYALAVTLVELAVIGVEAGIYRRALGLRWGRALLISGIANATSVAGGMGIGWITGWS